MPYQLACGYRFRSLGTRRPRPRLSGLWAEDVHLRSPLSPLPYPRRAGGAGLQAQSLPRSACSGHAKTKSPELEVTIAPPNWAIGWDVFCWIGHRRCSRHLAIPQIQAELLDAYAIKLSEDAIAQYIRRYQVMLAARQQDPVALRRQYQAVEEIILSIDGLQPEKGHETLYVVRELTQKRVWFAEALISATADEVRRLIAQGQGVGRSLGQDGGAVDVGPAGCVRHGDRGGVPGRAASLLRQPFPPRRGQARPGGRQPRQGSDAKKVRGLRKIEQAVLKRRKCRGVERPRGSRSGSDRDGDRGAGGLAGSSRPIRRAPWCSTIARRCAGSSTTIREARFILPACGWRRRWMRSANRSNGTWTRKKGVRGEATRPTGRLHRPRPGRSRGRTRDDPRLRRGHRGGGRDPRTWRRRVATERQEKFEELIDRFERDRGSDSPADGQGDDQLSRRPVRGRRDV